MGYVALKDAWRVFAGPFSDDTQLAVDRALAELRAGRPILVEGERGPLVAAAVDAAAPSLFDAVVAKGGGEIALVLSRFRARALGLPANGPVSVPIAGLHRQAVYGLAGGADAKPPEDWSPADAAALVVIELCKLALLLPAALTAETEMPRETPIHRIALDQARAVLQRSCHNLEVVSQAQVPLAGDIETHFVVFRAESALRDQVAIVVGHPDPANPVALRLHSACLTGDLFGSLRCDCGDQLRRAVACLAAAGGGVLLYLDQEGRGIGIRNKLRAYALQDTGFDTIDADAMLGYGPDERRYDLAAGMLFLLGYNQVRLLTNNPDKIAALRRAGIDVKGTQPLMGTVTIENRRYLSTKASKGGHLLDDLLQLAR
jgi:GTP cyclohydrolase II